MTQCFKKNKIKINLGGEGEIPNVINVQGPWVLDDLYRTSRTGKTIKEMQSKGYKFVIADNKKLPFKDNSIDEVITNSVPIDKNTHLGSGIQSLEIKRILKKNGIWLQDIIE